MSLMTDFFLCKRLEYLDASELFLVILSLISGVH